MTEQNIKALNILRERGHEIVTIIAKDSLVDNSFAKDKSKLSILQGLKTKNASETGQLWTKIELALSCRVALTTNISVPDGLVNGAMGTVQHFTRKENGQVHIIWIIFDNKQIGKDQRKTYGGLYRSNPSLDKSWTPIFAIYKEWQTGARGYRKFCQVSRVQFPLELGFSRSLTKIQGMSLDFRHYVDFTDLRMHNN